MTQSPDPLQVLKWVFDRTGDSGWIFGAIAVGIAWTWKRMRDWGRRNAVPLNPSKAGATVRWAPDVAPPPAPAPAAGARPAASAYTAAPSYAAAAYAAQPAYAAPPAAASHGGHPRKSHRDAPPAQRPAAPAAQRAPVLQPVPAAVGGGWSLSGAFGDPAHARTAIVIAEVLGPPVGLR